MKMLITMEEYEKLNGKDLIGFICENCSKTFFLKKRSARDGFRKKNSPRTNRFCCRGCWDQYRSARVTITCNCTNCGEVIIKKQHTMKKSKNPFCSSSCAGTYNNTHKTYGTRISKLEKYLAKQLVELFPSVEFHFNRKDAIDSELDIYLPSLKLAFELNGIFHYEPIYGEEQLKKVKNNDSRKLQACVERGIEFCIIDSSGQKYFKESTSQKYLDIIINLINQKLGRNIGAGPIFSASQTEVLADKLITP